MSEDFRNRVDADVQRREEENSRNDNFVNQVDVEKSNIDEKVKTNRKKDMETAQEYAPQRDTVKRVKPELDSKENDY